MDAELEVLSRTLRRTLTSLQNKRAYLLEQQHNYIGIRGKLLLLKESYRDSRTRGDTDELSLEKVDTLRGNGNGNEGLVFKDIVISNGKCYLNIGYEYYVEKGIEECLQFVDDKLTSIEDALVQFDKKIGEANDTMRGMSVYENGAGSSKDGSRIEEEEEEEEDQIMEIREELDDEGNIISSSVRPKPTEKDIEKLHESMVEGMKRTTPPKAPQRGNDDSGRSFLGDDFKKNLKGKLLSRREHTNQHISKDKAVAQGKHKTDRTKMQDGIEKISGNNSVSKNEDKDIKKANSEDTSVKQGSVTEVATDNIYTFDDLVRQLDEQDELEDGKIEEADIDYSMERFDLNNSLAKSTPTDEEGKEVDDDDDRVYHNDEDLDDDDLDSQRYSIVPNSAGRLSFLDQINKLRSPNLQKEAPRVVQKSVPVTKKSSQSAPPKKSILKRATPNEKSNEKKATEPQKEKKKNVGFAETLDIYEVENLKEETKRQTANFPRMPLMTPTTTATTKSNEDENGFDSDLFAQLIGARNPDELHDKYQEKIREIQAKEDAHLEESRGRRVSRFKKERHANEDDESALLRDETDSTKSNGKGSSGRAVMDIVEHDLEPETQTAATVGKRVSKFAQRMASKQAATSSTTNATTREPFVVKEMKSLQRPRINNSGRGRNSSTQLMSQKILEELSDSNSSGDEDNNADKNVDAPDKIPVKTVDNKAASQNTRIKEKLEKTGDKFEFPEEIKKILKERGKGEDSVRVANVDYSGLNDNLDDMARAYILGLYDDDLEEHPGTLVEKLDDFKSYNKQVDELKDDIDSFRRENPVLRQVRDGDDNENKDGSIMVDVVEHDFPEDYARDIMVDDDNYALNPDKLGEEVRRSYFEKREYMIQKLRKMSNENGVVKDIHEEPTGPIILPSEEMEEHELEPIDESGNPIKVSKFKAKRMNLRI